MVNFFLRQRDIEQIRLERERQEIANIRKKIEITNIESGIEAKRNEMAEKRAEDLADTYLKTKNLRVLLSYCLILRLLRRILILAILVDSKSFFGMVRTCHGQQAKNWQGKCTCGLEAFLQVNLQV